MVLEGFSKDVVANRGGLVVVLPDMALCRREELPNGTALRVGR